jgi:glutathione peroxidase
MKTFIFLIMIMVTTTGQSIYDFKVNSLEGEEIDFAKYKGKNLLIVNVASKCGFTPQYADLERLHEEFGEQVVVLGFPANNFGSQELLARRNQEVISKSLNFARRITASNSRCLKKSP